MSAILSDTTMKIKQRFCKETRISLENKYYGL